MMPSIFISYKRDHTASEYVARAIEKALGSDFVVLRDQTMQPGVRWSKELYYWLITCDAGIAIVCDDANKADWCRREWTILAARNEVAALPVIPIHIEKKVTTGILDELQGLEWTVEAIAISKLRKLLANLPSRVSTPKDFLAAHQAWLRWQFKEKRVMGKEPYSLADVYIDTECGECEWGSIKGERDGHKGDPFKEANGGRTDLIKAVLRRIADTNFQEIIVVQGSPGCGKSAFALRIADKLMDLGFTPICVRFRDLRLSTFPNLGELIDDAIRIGHNDEDSPYAETPIVATLLRESHSFEGTMQCRTVFIFDGWDEVSLTGNVSYQAQLRELLPRLRQFFVNYRAPRIRLLLTGRPSMEVDLSGVLLKSTPVLTIRPIRPKQLRDYAKAIKERLDTARRNELTVSWSIDTEKLEPLYADYSNWYEKYRKDQQATSNSSAEVLGNPLLAYLSLRVIAESKKNPEELLKEPTALYSELIETTVKYAGKGEDDGRQEETVRRGGENLRRLLHEVAATISILRSEAVSFKELKTRFEDTGLPIRQGLTTEWTDIENTENALRELIVNFYFKGGYSGLGCEFLHKSFREYLFAEAIFYTLYDTATNLQVTHEQLEYWQEFREGTSAFRASRRLAYLLAPQWLSREVEQHLTWLLRRAIREDTERWIWIRDLVTEVYAWWAEGVHLRHQPRRNRREGRWLAPFVDDLFSWTSPLDSDAEVKPIRTTVLDAHLGDALMRVTAALHLELPQGQPIAGARRSAYQSLYGGKLRFKPGGSRFMSTLLARLDAEGWRPSIGLGDIGLAGVDLSNERLAYMFGNGCHLDGALLARASLSQSQLSFAHLRGANLREGHLRSADMRGTEMREASLRGADLRDTNLSSADLRDADLRSADLRDADLIGATLNDADLSSADLRGADLSGADLRGADLSGADLRDADLNDADFADTNLTATKVYKNAFAAAKNWESSKGTPNYIDSESPDPIEPP